MQNVTQVASQPVYATTTWRAKYVSIRHWICYEVRCICVYNLYIHSTVMWLHKALLMSTLPAGNGEQCAMTEQLGHVLGYIQEGITNRPWHLSQSVDMYTCNLKWHICISLFFTELLSNGVVAASTIPSSVVSFLVGSLVGALVHHCFTKRRSKPDSVANRSDEMEMKGNVSYEHVKY